MCTIEKCKIPPEVVAVAWALDPHPMGAMSLAERAIERGDIRCLCESAAVRKLLAQAKSVITIVDQVRRTHHG